MKRLTSKATAARGGFGEMRYEGAEGIGYCGSSPPTGQLSASGQRPTNTYQVPGIPDRLELEYEHPGVYWYTCTKYLVIPKIQHPRERISKLVWSTTGGVQGASGER